MLLPNRSVLYLYIRLARACIYASRNKLWRNISSTPYKLRIAYKYRKKKGRLYEAQIFTRVNINRASHFFRATFIVPLYRFITQSWRHRILSCITDKELRARFAYHSQVSASSLRCTTYQTVYIHILYNLRSFSIWKYQMDSRENEFKYQIY